MFFPISGVHTPIWLPPLVAFVISCFTSMSGVSGAVVILPFQMSVLGFTSPAVSPTNMIFNIIAIPSGVYRYLREGRMVWPLTWAVVIGTAPGVVIGGFVRLKYLPNPGPFKAFAGCVLLYIGARLFIDVFGAPKGEATANKLPENFEAEGWKAKTVEFNIKRIVYEFQGEQFACGTFGIFLLSLIVGVVGGIYGIGGGAIIAPFFVAIYRLPVHTIAGATLMGTFVTSIFGVIFYEIVAPYYEHGGMSVSPDWLLGALFGIGGMAGMYVGARTQKYVKAKWLKILLGLILLAVAAQYVVGYISKGF